MRKVPLVLFSKRKLFCEGSSDLFKVTEQVEVEAGTGACCISSPGYMPTYIPLIRCEPLYLPGLPFTHQHGFKYFYPDYLTGLWLELIE